ncbi:hypothetical protein ACLD0W_12840 [Alloalcanivorax sp. C16-1]|uniref:hypothetical protein n=1 Tax=Alloalcanivorax sp. C16-1 TaxID=3390051 RepID=UPI003970A2F8
MDEILFGALVLGLVILAGGLAWVPFRDAPRRRGHLRGHQIHQQGQEFVYADTGEPTASTWRQRPCGHCGRADTPEGHDGCLGTVPGVMNACCGHGRPEEAYVQFADGAVVRGPDAVAIMRRLQRAAVRADGESDG